MSLQNRVGMAFWKRRFPGTLSHLSLPLLPHSPWLGVVVSVSVLFIDQADLSEIMFKMILKYISTLGRVPVAYWLMC